MNKQDLKKAKYWEEFNKFKNSFPACVKRGIQISPECVIDKFKWRIVINIVDKNGGVLERKVSDPKFYYTKEEYDLKVMELTNFYAES